MTSQGVPKEAGAEGDGILKIGDMQLLGRLISDASEEIMLLWAIGQPCTARQNNFVKQTSNHLKLDACGHNLCIQQSPSSMMGVTGGVMWDSGVVLGKFLEHAVDSDLLNLRGKKCVELGSGCGLVGCIATLLGGNVVLTDMPDRLRLLAKNVEENARELDARGSASVRELTWGEDLDSDLLNPLPDYVLGSDVVYNEAIVHDLLTTLQDLCGSHTIIFISAELRNGKPISLSVPIVQELALQDPHAVPDKYVASEQDRPSLLFSTCESDSVPVIDMSILRDNPKEMEKIALAAQEWGFFQVVNHGIPGSLMERMRSVVKSFFQLPLEEKLKYEMQNNQGYGQAFVASEEQRLDWADILFLFTLPVESRDMNLWPTTPENFRETMQDYALETKILAEKLLTALAQGLGIRSNCFLENFGELHGAVRMNYYPPCPRPELVLGLSPHSDAVGITILLQDDKCPWEALQVRKSGEWVSIPSIPGALVINIGDHLEVISNGRYKSVEHRAVTNISKERTSIATFYNPDNKVEVRPVINLIDEYHPCLYRKTTVFEYAMHCVSKKLEGKKSIDFLKVHEND